MRECACRQSRGEGGVCGGVKAASYGPSSTSAGERSRGGAACGIGMLVRESGVHFVIRPASPPPPPPPPVALQVCSTRRSMRRAVVPSLTSGGVGAAGVSRWTSGDLGLA